MEYVLSGLEWETCVVYLDDITVFSQTFYEHLVRLREELNRIKQTGLKISHEKCFILQKRVSFLGHVVNGEGISPDQGKVETIKSWPIPKTVKDMRAFVSICSYYRKFIKDFAKLAQPLHRLSQQNILFKWDELCNKAFETLKTKLETSPILTYSCLTEFIPDTDASDTCIRAVLSQVSDEER